MTVVNAATGLPLARLRHDPERPGRVPSRPPRALPPGAGSIRCGPANGQLILRGVAEADYHKPTVCTEFDVTQLAEHLIGSVTYLGAAALAGAGASAEPAQPVLGVTRQIIAFTGRNLH